MSVCLEVEISWWYNGEVHLSCGVQSSCCSAVVSNSREGDGKVFAEGFRPAPLHSLYALQVPFKPKVKNVLKPTRGYT